MTYILSFIVAFGVTAIAGQILIPVLRRLKAGQSIREDPPGICPNRVPPPWAA